MFTDQTLIIINVVCIVFMITMITVIAAATRMKGGAGWAAVCFLMMNVPIILVNLMREVTSEYYLFFVYPAYTINLLWFPAAWFFTRSQYDKSFRLTLRSLFYAIPALVSLVAHIVYYAPLSATEVEAEIIMMQAGGKNLPGIINDVFLYTGFIVYFACIFYYVRKRMKYLRDHFSDSDYIEIRWVPRFLIFCFVGILITAVAYAIYPRTDTWLIPIANMAGMAYLVYCVLKYSTTAYINRIGEAKSPTPALPEGEGVYPYDNGKNDDREKRKAAPMTDEQMKAVCDKVMNYLTTTGAYTNSDLSLAMLSAATGTPYTNLSRSINGYLKKNFFDIINELRVEEAKKRLRSHGSNYTIDSISAECGFKSRTTFYTAFKKIEGKKPLQWLKTG